MQDWVIIGQAHVDPERGVVLLASNKLTGSVHIHEEVSTSGRLSSVTVTITMADYIKIKDSQSYGEALARLFTNWRPGDAGEIEAP
jgi:hypothetical protein